jgi:hypothetical protein
MYTQNNTYSISANSTYTNLKHSAQGKNVHTHYLQNLYHTECNPALLTKFNLIITHRPHSKQNANQHYSQSSYYTRYSLPSKLDVQCAIQGSRPAAVFPHLTRVASNTRGRRHLPGGGRCPARSTHKTKLQFEYRRTKQPFVITYRT